MKKMKIVIVPLVLGLFLALNVKAQTQLQLNQQAGAKYQKADRDLNIIYQKILKEYATQSKFIKNLKSAQRLWVQLRDAELAAKFPDQGSYGSIEPMCEANYLTTLTKDRIKFIKIWLDGIQEGDACAGSVKTK